MKQQIQSHNFFYSAFRPIVDFATRCHYNHLVIKGLENIPHNTPFIYAPCHQNAMMDPLVVLCTTRRPVVFLCRADIFKKKLAREILTFLKILPVYRIRDGKSNLSKNEGIFQQTHQVLLDNVPLCLMAEGTHNDKHQLLPLVKGMFRIAGETQKLLGDNKDLFIAPVGLDYDDYERPFSNLVINIGTPIAITPFMETYSSDEPVALNKMRQRLSEDLKSQMLHIETHIHYDDVISACDILTAKLLREKKQRNNTWNRFLTRKEISARLDNSLVEVHENKDLSHLFQTLNDYRSLCKSINLTPRATAERWSALAAVTSLLCIAAVIAACCVSKTVLHIFLFAIACHPILFIPTHLAVRKAISDTQFRSSINFAVRFILCLLYIPAFSIVTGLNFGWLWGISAFFSAIIIARLSGPIYNWAYALFNNLKYRFATIFHSTKVSQIKTLEHDILQRYNQL